jgi:hypothetical protein
MMGYLICLQDMRARLYSGISIPDGRLFLKEELMTGIIMIHGHGKIFHCPSSAGSGRRNLNNSACAEMLHANSILL